MSYFEIMISDAQRLLIVAALKQCQMQGYHGADAETREEIDLLESMLNGMKDDESNYYVDPETGAKRHITHGLCL